jgi:Sec-independent protein translocase protein TatA
VFLFSPEKLLVILVVAMVVVGPDKLPRLAAQLGAFWRDLQRWRARLESETKSVFPDLPPFESIGHAVRSPLSYLDRLATESTREVRREDEQPEVTIAPSRLPGFSGNEVDVVSRKNGRSSSNFDPSMN